MRAHSRAALLALLLAPVAALGQLTASNAWVRATVPAQKSTAAYLTLVSAEKIAIVAVASPIAAHVELHETSNDNGVMKMRAVDRIEMQAGRPLELRPGGLHVMLMGLRRPVATGEQVPLHFTVERGGKRSAVEVRAEARAHGSR